MFEEYLTPDERQTTRGQVGIGTLIVFIAMVLVAAIAAGVLINTAGFLQQQSQETGQQSSEQVSNTIQAVNEVGVADGSGNLKTVRLTVSRSPGANPINLADLTITVSGPNGEGVLSYVGNGSDTNAAIDDTTNAGYYELGAKIGSGPSFGTTSKTLQQSSDKAVILVSFSIGSGAQQTIAAGEQVTLTISVPSGGTTTVQINAPTPLSQASNGEYIQEV
ncbi:MAG: archaellin/type IV pilin N-terminal domain-containing protein [Haloferacaceae archaeon]